MKINEMVGARPTLEKVAGMEVDGGKAREFAEFVKDVLVAIQEFEVKRAELFRKYGEEEGEGAEKNIKILPENEKKFNTAIKRALNKEVDLAPFDLASLGISIAPADLVNALPLFK